MLCFFGAEQFQKRKSKSEKVCVCCETIQHLKKTLCRYLFPELGLSRSVKPHLLTFSLFACFRGHGSAGEMPHFRLFVCP